MTRSIGAWRRAVVAVHTLPRSPRGREVFSAADAAKIARRPAGGRGAAHRGPPHARDHIARRRRRAGGQRRRAQRVQGAAVLWQGRELGGHKRCETCVAATCGCVITGAQDGTIQMWHDGVMRARILAHAEFCDDVAVLPGSRARASSAPRATVTRRSCGRSMALSSGPLCATRGRRCPAALPDGVHFVVGTGGLDEDEDLAQRRACITSMARTATPSSILTTPSPQMSLFKGHADRCTRWR